MTTSQPHTKLTPRNYAGFTATMLVIEFVIVGMGAIDLLMFAPLGINHLAAVGLGDVIAVAVFAFFAGLVHSFSTKLAASEGAGDLHLMLPTLGLAALLVTCCFQALGVLFGCGFGDVLLAMRQDPSIIPAVDSYFDTRMYGVLPALVCSMLGVILRVVGAKKQAIIVLALAFFSNALFDYLFVHTNIAQLFTTPEAAIAWATVGAHSVSIPLACILLARVLRQRQRIEWNTPLPLVLTSFRQLLNSSCTVGGRHFNDYMSATIPIIFIGTLGTSAVAATAVAGKLYTLYCRFPQSCFESAMIFYSYDVKKNRTYLLHTARKVSWYAGLTTLCTSALILVSSPWLVSLFSMEGPEKTTTLMVFVAYMAGIPMYFADQLLARFLVVHQQGKVLLTASLLTYVVALPLAAIAVFQLQSPPTAIASRTIVFTLSAYISWRALKTAWCQHPHTTSQLKRT